MTPIPEVYSTGSFMSIEIPVRAIDAGTIAQIAEKHNISPLAVGGCVISVCDNGTTIFSLIIGELSSDQAVNTQGLLSRFGVERTTGNGKNIGSIEVDLLGRDHDREHGFGRRCVSKFFLHREKGDTCLLDWGLPRTAALIAALPAETLTNTDNGLVVMTEGDVLDGEGLSIRHHFAVRIVPREGLESTYDVIDVTGEKIGEDDRVFVYYYKGKKTETEEFPQLKLLS